MKDSLESFFDPESIAIIGASLSATSITGQPLRHLLDRKYGGRIYPVNAKYKEIAGINCYGSVAELPAAVDLAVIVIKAVSVPDVLVECGKKGIRTAVVISGGFAEAGEIGRALQEKVSGVCREYGIRVVGPNSQGMLNVGDDVCAGFGPVLGPEYGVQPGALSFVTQSGGFGFAVVSLMAQQGLGFRKIVSTGNEADLTALDFIEHFIHDSETQVIIAYLEGLTQGLRLKELAERAIKADKPILLWKVGSTDVGKRAARSHTASLSGDQAISQAVFKQIGVVAIGDVHELVDYSRSFLSAKRPHGKRVAILSASGGAGVLISDECIHSGLEVPILSDQCKQRLAVVAPALGSLQNPIDVMGGVYNDPERLRQMLEVLASDPSLDSIAVINPLRKGRTAADIARVIVEMDRSTEKPIFVTWSARPDFAAEAFSILSAAGVPYFDTPVRCARALGMLTRYAELRRRVETRGVEKPFVCERPDARALLRSSKDAIVGEYAAKRILALYDIPITREKLATGIDEALAIAGNLKYPVAIKVQSPDIAHKTDAGVIGLDIASPQDLARAYEEVLQNAKQFAPDATIEGVLIQEMVAGGIETILGVVYDPSFGPVVMFGLGGIYAEVLHDIAFRAAPITYSQALEMISETRCYQILLGARTGTEADIEALADVIVRVAAMAADLRSELAELDINPLVVMPKGQGVKAVDALMTIGVRQS